MANAIKWKGSKAIHLQPEYPEYFERSDSAGFNFAYEGPYQTLVAQKPTRGSVLAGYAGYRVEEVRIKPKGAGVTGPGVMTFNIVSEGAAGAGTTDETIVEVDAGQLQKSIYDHPAFDDLEDTDKAKVRKAVEDKKTEPPPLTPSGDNINQASNLFYRLIKGVESYLVAAPEVKKTTYSYTRPTVGAIGKGTRTTAKPDPSAPDGYQWLKTADRAVRQGRKGKWERIQVWTAADEWDELLYG